MIRLVLFSLFFTTVNCQLAYIWLNYQHFQCSQNANNYFESIHHQYLCTSSLIWTCISDVNDYSDNAIIFLDYFCGFIDGQNALQPHTIWNIHLKPNVHIHFLKFVLLDNYWYCDYEYLRVYSNNKTTTFCGLRLPWVHDASDTKMKIILMTQRTGIKNQQLELLYYGAYVEIYQHFIIFTSSSSLRDIHYPNTEQNAFESFHLISSNRLDIMELEAMNTCSKGQVVCCDGPGFKSPRLQLAYNQSVRKCMSSTFQMICKFSRVDDVCTSFPHLHYRAIRERDHQVKNFHRIKRGDGYNVLSVYEAHSKGTSKYIYRLDPAPLGVGYLYINLTIKLIPVSFPYMVYEGNSCMYGGIYIVRTTSSNYSEILSRCTAIGECEIYLHNISVVIIHYSEYSTEEITFYALYEAKTYPVRIQAADMDLTQKYKENTLSITVPKCTTAALGRLHSSHLKLRKIQYINISCNALLNIKFSTSLRTSCMNITIFYFPHVSNIRGRQYDQKAISGHRSFTIWNDFIQSVVINMCACTFDTVPVWFIEMHGCLQPGEISTNSYSYQLTADYLLVEKVFSTIYPKPLSWLMFQMLKPEDVPAYAIWRVFTDIDDQLTAHVSIEVLIDNHHSSSVYEWHNFKSFDGIYITVYKAVNILIESVNTHLSDVHIFFIRHFIHDDKINKYMTGPAPQQINFSFHNQR